MPNSNPEIMDAGYVFHSRSYPHAPGHPQLDVFLREEPTLRHFDPETVRLRVQTRATVGAGAPEDLIVHHPWTAYPSYTVYPGRIRLRDRFGKRQEAFAFGGSMTIQSGDDVTTCSITSPAPILELFSNRRLSDLLASEVEILWAEERAHAGVDRTTFENWLDEMDPSDLYAACLESLHRRFGASHHKELPHIQGLLSFVRDEIEALQQQGRWPANAATLQERLH
ncbi:MAG: hypothetical protein WBR18_07585 [Anaerolineales bacterium]